MKPEFLVRAFVVSQELSWQPLHKGHALYTRLPGQGFSSEVHPPVRLLPPSREGRDGHGPILEDHPVSLLQAYTPLCPEVLPVRLPRMFLGAAAGVPPVPLDV